MDELEISAPASDVAAEPVAAESKASPSDIVERWWEEFFTGGGTDHPVPYLSGPWHHVFEAKEALKKRLAALAS